MKVDKQETVSKDSVVKDPEIEDPVAAEDLGIALENPALKYLSIALEDLVLAVPCIALEDQVARPDGKEVNRLSIISEDPIVADLAVAENLDRGNNPEKLVTERRGFTIQVASLFSFYNVLYLHFLSSKSDTIAAIWSSSFSSSAFSFSVSTSIKRTLFFSIYFNAMI